MKIDVRAPDHDDSQIVLVRLSGILQKLTGDSGTSSFDSNDTRQERAVFVVGYEAGKPIACGALRPISDDISELKRMYAENGVGSEILNDLEKRAIEMGYSKIWLSTRVVNVRAIRFYQKHGYQKIPNFGKYAGRENTICFEKRLV